MRSILKESLKLLAAVVLCQIPGLLGVLSAQDVADYYRRLIKPSFAPPPAIFGPVWTVLYAMMGIALYLAWRSDREAPEKKRGLAIFAGQLALNAAWTPVFFGLKQPGAALIVIGLLFLAVAATILAFWPLSAAAALLLVPYLLWVGFASLLNLELWRRN
jgi:benzodiazapine receptor